MTLNSVNYQRAKEIFEHFKISSLIPVKETTDSQKAPSSSLSPVVPWYQTADRGSRDERRFPFSIENNFEVFGCRVSKKQTYSVSVPFTCDSKKNVFCLVRIILSENQLEKDCIGQRNHVSQKAEFAMFVPVQTPRCYHSFFSTFTCRYLRQQAKVY